jgi:hypothetical protein
MLANIPLLIVPFILYNLGLVGAFGPADGGDLWAKTIFSLPMVSGGVFSLTLGDVLILVALLLFFVEIVKSTHTSIIDHVLSTLVFIAFLAEFVAVRDAAHSVFFTLTLIALIDVAAGFSVSRRRKGRP